ncbi:alpha-L-glutamate ligase RimK family [Clostridium sp. CAG:253]|nr:alpha-L-glutamate ligase RimK family [Clostridium sp. CAG:253]
MNIAYIIYYDEEAKKNSGFIDMLKSECRKYDIAIEYISFEKVNLMSESSFENKFKKIFFVINRTREYKLSLRFEKINVKVFHSSKITELGNNKYKTYCCLKEYFEKNKNEPQGEWIAHTVLVKADDLNNVLNDYIGKDYVIKSVDGHGGSQVFSLNDDGTKLGSYRKNRDNAKNNIYKSLQGHDCVLQKRIDSDSNDIRVYIVFGKIYAAVLRHGNDGFKSNFSLGGSVEEYFLDEEQKKFIEKFIEAFGAGQLSMAGIDFILTRDGNLIFNELEEMVGSRMLYNCSKHDIVRKYVEQIAKLQERGTV